MQNNDVVIIGAGASGLACAITLGSGTEKSGLTDKKIVVIDAGESHLNKAQLFNAPGIPAGTEGPALIESLKRQASAYPNISIIHDTVTTLSGSEGAFTLTTATGTTHQAATIVLAPGMQTIAIEGLEDKVKENIRAPRPGMLMIDHQNGLIEPGLYVTGCAAGVASMFAAAAGAGTQSATDILSQWIGKYTVPHDVIKKR